MKKLIMFLIVIAAVYGVVGNALVESGTASIKSAESRMAKVGV